MAAAQADAPTPRPARLPASQVGAQPKRSISGVSQRGAEDWPKKKVKRQDAKKRQGRPFQPYRAPMPLAFAPETWAGPRARNLGVLAFHSKRSPRVIAVRRGRRIPRARHHQPRQGTRAAVHHRQRGPTRYAIRAKIILTSNVLIPEKGKSHCRGRNAWKTRRWTTRA